MEKGKTSDFYFDLKIAAAVASLCGLLLMCPLNQARAATIERIIAPREMLDLVQIGPSLDRIVASSNTPAQLNAVNVFAKGRMLDLQAFLADLASAKRGQWQDQISAPNLGSVMIEKGYVLDVQRQIAASGASKILDLNHDENWTACFGRVSPTFSHRDTDDHAARTHLLLKVKFLQVEGIGGYAVSTDGLLISMTGNLNSITCGMNSLFGGKDSFRRQSGPEVNVNQSYDQKDDTDAGEDEVPPSPKSGFPGPLSGLPLSAQFAAAIFLTLAAWPLNRVLQRLIYKSLTIDEPYSIRFTLIAACGFYCWLMSISYAWASVLHPFATTFYR